LPSALLSAYLSSAVPSKSCNVQCAIHFTALTSINIYVTNWSPAIPGNSSFSSSFG